MSDKASIYSNTDGEVTVYFPFSYEMEIKPGIMGEKEFIGDKYSKEAYEEYVDIKQKHNEELQKICDMFVNLVKAQVRKLDAEIREVKAKNK